MKKVITAAPAARRSPAAVVFFFATIFFGLIAIVGAQTQRNATTDPTEARILNSIFRQWGISSSISSSSSATYRWNITGEVCSGAATDLTSFAEDAYNPALKCDCSHDSGTTCRITQLKVYALDVVGVIPDELWNLTFLTNLDLRKNYLRGPLSASIGNLARMQYLSVGTNALSGELPKELGKLTDLRSLSFTTNDFSGPLPSELGSLTKLEQFYFDSSGVSGGIPQTFANLQNLITVWASDNDLTGRIPDFIGTWSKLTVLRFQGNSFEGPIPNTLSNLTSLTDLRISDLYNGSSSLEFIKDMKSLTTLILRNNNISGTIPSNIGEYQSLSQLDLSFNNLTGQIPNSLFNLSSLSYLFLGNNRLTGILPTQKSALLLNIDLSYNELSGTFPRWISQSNLQLNLVANNFTIESSNSSLLPSGLNCLQRGFTCNRGPPTYFNFSIKCGGPKISSSNGIVYESDNEALGPAMYHVTPTNRWAVSNVGRFAENTNQQYKSSSSSQFTNTLDSELFQTARISPGSLRYYGLGLENGNYTVRLQFAEIAILTDINWWSLGKRVFDIIIQGNRVLKDFDIRKEAGGTSLRAVSKEYKVQVSENYLEIHLFWAGKGTCCVPFQGTYGPSISSISATPDFTPTVSNNPPTKKKNRTGLIVGIVVPVAVVSFLSVFLVFFIIQRRKKRDTYEDEGTMVNAGEINAKLNTYMLQQDERLKRIEDSITTLTANVQASITTLEES